MITNADLKELEHLALRKFQRETLLTGQALRDAFFNGSSALRAKKPDFVPPIMAGHDPYSVPHEVSQDNRANREYNHWMVWG